MGQGSFRGLQAAATGHLQSLGLLWQAVWLFPSIALQLPAVGPRPRTQASHPSLPTLVSGSQATPSTSSPMELSPPVFLERITGKAGGEGRKGVLSHLGGGRTTHTTFSRTTFPDTYRDIGTHTLDSSRREEGA